MPPDLGAVGPFLIHVEVTTILFDIAPPEARQVAKAYAGQAGLLACDMVIDPCFAHAKPRRNIADGEQLFGMSVRVIRHNGSDLSSRWVQTCRPA